jgi:hypothetical protein
MIMFESRNTGIPPLLSDLLESISSLVERARLESITLVSTMASA